MPHLKQKGKDLNADIGTLVKKGLGADLAKAMDVLRVIGNNAVHPGQIDLKDDKAIALKLFETLNLIIERLISMPNRVEALFQGLPKGALKTNGEDGTKRVARGAISLVTAPTESESLTLPRSSEGEKPSRNAVHTRREPLRVTRWATPTDSIHRPGGPWQFSGLPHPFLISERWWMRLARILLMFLFWRLKWGEF